MTRTERQKLSIHRWLQHNGHAAIVACTGFGKTYMTVMLIEALYKRNKNLKVLIAVPTTVLQEQWQNTLIQNNLFTICSVVVFNTIITQQYDVDLFVVDECHLSASSANITMYQCVNYRYVLGLTATWERLDNREDLLLPYMNVCDTITLTDALKYGWISPYRKYKVLIRTDLTLYNELNRKFQSIFAVFSHDFKLIMQLINHPKKVPIWAKKMGLAEGVVRGYLATFMRLLRQRKSFVMSHPKKFELVQKILNARTDKKCIVFTSTVKDAETFKKQALVLHSQRKKAENKKTLEAFNAQTKGIIVAPKALDAGVDVKGLSVGIAMTCDSSQITAVQRTGRVIRLEEGKTAEFFTLVIANTVEETWYSNANKGQSYITISEEQLNIVLTGGIVQTRPKTGIVDLENRY